MGLNQPNQVNSLSEVGHSPKHAAIAAVPTYRQSLDGGRPDLIASWPDYMIDAVQRSVLFLDLLRQRGNEQIEITSRPMATVLIFDQKLLMDGRSLPRPINYTLSRIIAPPDVVTEPKKRPVVVIDPRAGQGPGVGGFKAASEIGDALNAGHPVYFIGFGAIPAPGQQFLDVVEGQVSFFEHIAALHPNTPPPFVIGNCQAGYQTLMVAALRPELFGPCMVAGSPMSYWQGVHGKNPMRYAGGLLGGSWLNAMSADLGNGKIDGTQLILNFDMLNPAYWLWGKQYEVYAQVDSDAVRYLKFEKWWGDFIELNGDELQFLVDNMFIGDKLTRNQLQSHNGTTFDLRNITSPIIVFTSMVDNISPPQQSLGWILDLYRDVDDIRASERTIVYCLSQEVGHLAIFVSSKVGAKQDEEFVQLMDVIDCLPPGLFEIVIAPRPDNVPAAGFITGEWIARFEDRSLDDIRALGRNSLEDDRAFAAVARMSEINLSLYRTFMQPMVRALANQPMASMTRTMAPLRLSYTLFADRNPMMKGVQTIAAAVTSMRRPVTADNPFLAVQEQVSQHITAALDAWRDARDSMEEKAFFGFYGSPIVQAMLGIHDGTEVRPRPTVSVERVAAQKVRADGYAAKLKTGGYNAALTRAVLYVTEADRMIEQRTALAFNVARENIMHLSLADFRVLVREQFFVLQLAGEQAVDALASMVIKEGACKELLKQVHAIVGADDPPSVGENERLTKLSQVLSVPIDTAVIPVVSDPCCEIDKSLIVSRKADELDIGDHCIPSTNIGNTSRVPSARKSNPPGKLQ
ncbi:DUF3141 domain-containing protein [Rugamonas sp. CCM 8940]|uniref:DUF3141 domain-containing protein n=1 Tax=Rugamonas sp. CCM 8940 TaxID=2765359 RepID=UPI0018F2CB65|nr:DUF3141 domain-containing protein [Rugamonas sp. CCM 8940]MBJ7309053.1 DUF3141 domain-containing protein [Rugamonas sp. CCM 8940]